MIGAYRHIKIPAEGSKIRVVDGKLAVPDQVILCYIEGDGVGPELSRACLRVWDAAVAKAYNQQRKIHWCEAYLGDKAAGLYDGNTCPDETLAVIRELRVAIKGPLATPVGGALRNANIALRKALDLYACVRPVRHYAGVPSPLKRPDKVDVVIFRDNTEDVLAGIEFKAGSPQSAQITRFLRNEMNVPIAEATGIGIKPVSEAGSKRLVRKAIEYAIAHGRDSVTLVHKGNRMKFTEGAFRNWGYEVARSEFGGVTLTEEQLFGEYKGKQPEGKIVIKDRIADIMFQMMLLRPEEFDVLATLNLNGEYLADSIAAEVGGVGIAPGANVSDEIAVFEATHGAAPKSANQNRVNPGSMLFSGVMMLEHLGWDEAAELVRIVYSELISDGVVTPDFARQMDGATAVGTSQFADALIERIHGGVDIEAKRKAQQAQLSKERRQRDIRRLMLPLEEMLDTGRVPQTVGDLMTRSLITVLPSESVERAMRLMTENDVDSLVVEPGEDGLWGILTRRDIVTKIVRGNRNPATTRVVEVATTPVLSVPAETSIHEASELLTESHFDRLTVTDRTGQGRIIGIVTETDIFEAVEKFGWAGE